MPVEIRSVGESSDELSVGREKGDKSDRFNYLIDDLAKLDALERTTELRWGSDKELDRILKLAIKDASNKLETDYLVQLLGTASIKGREFQSFRVFIEGNWPDRSFTRINYINNLAISFDNAAFKLGFSWRFGGFINLSSDKFSSRADKSIAGGLIYSGREDKSENAPTFLKRVYADELAAGTLTLADLKGRDKSLWAGLRNWASAGKHDLDAVIPRGKNTAGRPPLVPLVDPTTLDPSDPRDALALRAIRQRLTDRARLQKWRLSKATHK